MTLVRFGRGDDGRDGGSWMGIGVSDIILRQWKLGCLEGR